MIEFSFRYLRVWLDEIGQSDRCKDIIAELNHRFRENGVGYEFNYEANEIVRIDNQVLHQEAIRPAIHLLADPTYKTANEEYLAALEDYKKGDLGDCLTKCCSSLESVMKIICDKKGWQHDPKAKTGPLLKIVLPKLGLPPFFEQPLIVIASMRHTLSPSHGAGTKERRVDEYMARYALNASGSAIVLLVEAAS